MRSWSRTVGYYRYNSSSSSCGPQRNVVVALSGGVDSSVAAALLLSDNHNLQYNVSAIHMSNWSFRDEDPSSDSSSFEKASKRISACSSDADWEHARKIANALTLPIRRLSLESDYWIRVFEPYVQAIAERGVMPNPDLSCNRHIKFGALLEHVLQTHGEQALLATGHYARLWKPNHHHGSLSSSKLNYQIPDWLQTWSRSPILLAGVDESKDQSYFLASCQPQAFQHVIFPLGDYYKSKRQLPKKNPQDDAPCSFSSDASMPILEPSLPPQPTVREMAATWNLPSATQRESMGICFIGKRQSFAEFMAAYMPLATRRIRFVDVDTGTVIHESQECAHPVFYTPGQGARIGGVRLKTLFLE
jgi:tRNA-specific 2-thiouridylase